MSDADTPIEGQALVATAALASVPPKRLYPLLVRVQRDLGPRIESYERRFEAVYDQAGVAVFLVPDDHWTPVFERLGFGRREADAVRRAHNEQLCVLGSRTNRRAEFESALEIRDAVAIGR